MSKNKALIEIENLEYKGIFRNLSIKIYNGYSVLAGASLSGKTTLLKVMGGLIKSENIKYNDNLFININKKEILDNIKYIDIEEEIFKDYIVEDVFTKALINRKKDSKEYKEIIKISRIIDITNKKVSDLTLFERAKFLIGLSLVTNPKILLIDNLCVITSKSERKEIENILNEVKNTGIALVVSSPNLVNVKYVDNIYVLNKGEIVMEGKKEDILKEDNKLNKYSLDLPFIYDLSAKLIDYNLIQNVIDDIDRMVKALWK